MVMYARHEAQPVVLSVESHTPVCSGVREEFSWGVVLFLVCASGIFPAVVVW